MTYCFTVLFSNQAVRNPVAVELDRVSDFYVPAPVTYFFLEGFIDSLDQDSFSFFIKG